MSDCSYTGARSMAMLSTTGTPARPSRVHRLFLLAVLALTAIPAWQLFATLPGSRVMMEQLIPAEVHPGETVLATGYALDPDHIQELYLIDQDGAMYRA